MCAAAEVRYNLIKYLRELHLFCTSAFHSRTLNKRKRRKLIRWNFFNNYYSIRLDRYPIFSLFQAIAMNGKIFILFRTLCSIYLSIATKNWDPEKSTQEAGEKIMKMAVSIRDESNETLLKTSGILRRLSMNEDDGVLIWNVKVSWLFCNK